MKSHEPIPMTKDKEQEALKDEQVLIDYFHFRKSNFRLGKELRLLPVLSGGGLDG
jgi:hypothetical protein